MKVCELISNEIEFGKAGLFLVGGRPAMGKTAFARSVSIAMAEKGYKIGYFSFEHIQCDLFSDTKQTKNEGDMPKLEIDILDTVPETVKNIEDNCIDKYYDMVIIDYLQLIDREDGCGIDVIDGLRRLADKLDIPVIVLSQLPRTIETRDDHRPRVEDLSVYRIDAAIFDQLFLLYRGSLYDDKEDPSKMIVIKKIGEDILEWDEKSRSLL